MEHDIFAFNWKFFVYFHIFLVCWNIQLKIFSLRLLGVFFKNEPTIGDSNSHSFSH